MLEPLKKLFKWSPIKLAENKKTHNSLLLSAFTGLLEDILFWESTWLSLSFIVFVNILFFVCIHEEVNILGFLFAFCIWLTSIDALEAWLKYKHRSSFLKRLSNYEPVQINAAVTKIKYWSRRYLMEFLYLRNTNHAKAFFIINVVLGIIFLTGQYMSGYTVTYLCCMLLCVYKQIAAPVLQFAKNLKLNLESDVNLEDLIPDVTEDDMKLLSIEPEKQVIDEKQSLDYWMANNLPIVDSSDSSDGSSSILTHVSMEKIPSLDLDVETSDSSEDEYMPLVKQQEKLQSTLELITDDTWSSTAYNAIYNLTGAVANMVYPSSTSRPRDTKRKGASPDSDTFEIIDKSDLL